MAEYENHNDPRLNKFTKKEQKNFFAHPMDIATKIKSSELVDEDIFCLLRDHHESPDGFGFPNKLKDDQLHPLSRVFLIAHEYVTKMYGFDFEPAAHNEIIEYLESIFKSSNYTELVKSL
jgi:response regulator RpfG family c-di-GMP phosphodiesterase